jgi:hypothetical protein
MLVISKASKNQQFSWKKWPKKNPDNSLEGYLIFYIKKIKNHDYSIKIAY